MSEMVIRNKLSKQIGIIRIDKRGKQTAYNRKGEKIGCFDPKTNYTRDMNNRVLGTGNMLAGLILSAA